MGTHRFRGRVTAPPVTVTARCVRGRPINSASWMAYTVATLNTAHFTSRGSRRGHLPAGDGLDDLLFRPQGVAGAHGENLHPAAGAAQAALHSLHGVELIPLCDQNDPLAL